MNFSRFDRKIGSMGMEVPQHTQETLEGYLLRGWEPGGFVTAMLAMDMERALATADTANRQMMWVVGRWIIEDAPPESWGSYDQVTNWCKDINGRRTKWAMWYELNNKEEPQDYSF